ncbi:MAG: HlyD family efflux transporter periplasmic adaptor subunit [Planctomycetia bacterium]|nr:HlyD family efflux transporter periplasmic adaptor subunit [Planctomycetia bacterium]
MFGRRVDDAVPIPWRIRWQRFRYGWFPAVAFVLSLILVAALWRRQEGTPNTIGRVEAARANVAPVVDGQLVPLGELADGRWRLFDPVERGQVVARLNDQPLRALLSALHNDAAALRAELEATEAKAVTDREDLRYAYLRGSSDLLCQVERDRLDALDRLAMLEEDRLELSRLGGRLDVMKKARLSGMVTEAEMADVQSQRDRAAKLMDAHAAALRQAEENGSAAAQRWKTYPSPENPDLTKLLAPIRASIAAAEARVDEVRARMEMLEIRSPITGRVCAVYFQPGQAVRAGESILTIAADRADYITAYVRQEQRFRPAVHMPVGIRVRMPGQRMTESTVESVGSQFEPMPSELLRDQRIPELALPVRIAIPDGLGVWPGEVVDVRFMAGDQTDNQGTLN